MLRAWSVAIMLLTICSTTSYSQYTWKRYCDLKSSRQYFDALYIGNNEILVVGGFINSTGIRIGNPTRSCEIINTVNGTSSFTDSMSSAKAEFIALLTPDSNVIAISGLSNASGELTSQIELFNRTTKKWSVLGNLQVARRQHSAVMISNTEILVVGGRLSNLASIATAEIFDITTGVSRFVKDYPFALNLINLAMMQNGNIVGYGGIEGGANSFRPSGIYRYIPSTNTWTKIDDMPTGMASEKAFANTWDKRLFIYGGGLSESPTTNARWTYLEGANGTFSRLGEMQEEKRSQRAGQLNRDTLLVSGGSNVQILPRRSVDWVNIQTGMVTPGPPHLEPRLWHQVVSVPIAKNGLNVPIRGKIFAISGMTTSNTATPLVEVLDAVCATKPTLTANRSVICGGDTTLMDAGQGFTTYRWNTGAQSRTIVVQTGGSYWVEVTDANGCSGRDTVRLTVNPKPNISISILPSDTLCLGEIGSFRVNGGGNGATYNWTPTTGLSTSSVANPQFNIASLGTYRYTVMVTDANGCSETARATVTVKSCNDTISITTDRSIQSSLNHCDSLLSSVFIANDGDIAVVIDSLSLIGGVQRGATLDTAFMRQIRPQFFPMILPPKTSKIVPIRIIPIVAGDYSVEIVAYYNRIRRKIHQLIGKSFKRDIILRLLGGQRQRNRDFDLPVYSESLYWEDLKVNDVMMTILYDRQKMEYLGDTTIQVSLALKDTWKATLVADSTGLGRIGIRFQSTTPSTWLTKNDTLLRVGFRPLVSDSSTISTEPVLRYTLPSKRSDCSNNISQTSPLSFVSTVSVCDEDRESIIKDTSFMFASVTPNPTHSMMRLQYRIGIESYTELKLYDMNGRMVSILYRGILGGGLYEELVDVSGLAEGVYYCTMTSAGNTFTQQVLIVR